MPQTPSIKGVLANFGDPTDQLKFQYNPTEIRESKSVNWVEAAIPGGDDTLATFGNGASLEISMSLFFNVHGEGRSLAEAQRDREWVEDALSFLYRFTETEENNVELRGRAPAILLLVMGNIRWPRKNQRSRNAVVGRFPGLPVRLNQLDVTRTMFSKFDFTTRRATADITLVRNISFPR